MWFLKGSLLSITTEMIRLAIAIKKKPIVSGVPRTQYHDRLPGCQDLRALRFRGGSSILLGKGKSGRDHVGPRGDKNCDPQEGEENSH